MLARLFSSISLGAIIRAVFTSLVLLLLLATLLYGYPFTGFSMSSSAHPVVAYLLVVLTFGIGILMFNRAIVKVNFLKPSYHVVVALASFSVVFAGFYSNLNVGLSFIVASICVGKLLLISQHEKPYWLLTEVGLTIGVGLYLNTHFSILLLLTWLACFFYGSFTLRNITIPLFGIFVSGFLIGASQWLLNNNFMLPSFNWQFHTFSSLNLGKTAIQLSPIVIGFMLTLGDVFTTLSKGKVNKRQSMGFLLVSLIVLLFAVLLIDEPQLFGLLLAFPLAVFQSNYINFQKKWWLQDICLLAPWVSLLLLFLY